MQFNTGKVSDFKLELEATTPTTNKQLRQCSICKQSVYLAPNVRRCKPCNAKYIKDYRRDKRLATQLITDPLLDQYKFQYYKKRNRHHPNIKEQHVIATKRFIELLRMAFDFHNFDSKQVEHFMAWALDQNDRCFAYMFHLFVRDVPALLPRYIDEFFPSEMELARRNAWHGEPRYVKALGNDN